MKGDRRVFAAGLLLSIGLHAAALWAFRAVPAGTGVQAPPVRQFNLIAVPAPREVPHLEVVRAEQPSEPPRQSAAEPAPAPSIAEPVIAPAPAEPAAVLSPMPAPIANTLETPAAPPPAAPASAARRAHGRYEQTVAQWVERQRSYPLAARQRRWEGTAIVRLRLAPDGSLVAAQLVRDTGFALLDQAALGMVRRAAPYPRLPEEIGEGQIEVLVPIQFSLGS
ncbi:MAG TPA: TonB family protein [Longimicrobiaceae bacterium]|nr:TonB family protein [Longimicrobiaceae bacterium]